MSGYSAIRMVLKAIAAGCIAAVMALVAIVVAIVDMMKREY